MFIITIARLTFAQVRGFNQAPTIVTPRIRMLFLIYILWALHSFTRTVSYYG